MNPFVQILCLSMIDMIYMYVVCNVMWCATCASTSTSSGDHSSTFQIIKIIIALWTFIIWINIETLKHWNNLGIVKWYSSPDKSWYRYLAVWIQQHTYTYTYTYIDHLLFLSTPKKVIYLQNLRSPSRWVAASTQKYLKKTHK